MAKSEPEAMLTAYEALKGLDRDTENRIMLWLSHRLREHRRGREASSYKGMEPSEWLFHFAEEDETGSYDTRDEGIDEAADTPGWRIIEVEGRAAVYQEFLVSIPWSDGQELRSFKTREEAEQCVVEGKAHFAKRENHALNTGEDFDGEAPMTEPRNFDAWCVEVKALLNTYGATDIELSNAFGAGLSPKDAADHILPF